MTTRPAPAPVTNSGITYHGDCTVEFESLYAGRTRTYMPSDRDLATMADSDRITILMHIASNEDIAALRIEAGAAGDLVQVDLCDQALDGDEEARWECAEVLATTRREMAEDDGWDE